MKKILGFLIIISMAANSYALTETLQKVYQGVQDLKTNIQDAAGAVAAGDTSKMTEHLNKAAETIRNTASDVLATKAAVKDVVPKVGTAKEALKAASDDASKLHDTAQKAKEVVKAAVDSHINNNPEAAKKHIEGAYDLLNELVPELESLKNRLGEAHEKAAKLSGVVQAKPESTKGTFASWFE